MSDDSNDQLNIMNSYGDVVDEDGNPYCDPFPPPPADSPYRYFNQPIEQVPGWNPGKAQILYHAENHGLVWQNIPDCIDVITCAEVSGNCGSGGYGSGGDPVLKFKQRRIRPIQDEEELKKNTCENISLQELNVVTCISIGASEITITRQKIYVLGIVGCEADTDCYNIPLESCPDNGSES